ncbi:MAG: nicotinate-nucleotide adenylyltransferase [Candidatus Aminicenantes bacterium]|nr:nicotinate-nucleotide adenylyltransferase [Candidatus Aminicenantes bacterium]
MKERIGLLGGTFDPVHAGHLRAAAEVRLRIGLDRILFIPSFSPPHKGRGAQASSEDRYRMVELACVGDPHFIPSRLEVEEHQTSYSVRTVEKVRRTYPDAWIFFILGVDAFLEIATWREAECILEECLWVVTTRPGVRLDAAGGVLGGRLRPRLHALAEDETADETLFGPGRIFLLPIPALDISSTEVRRRVRAGETIRDLVPASVEAYIHDRGLYRS